QELEKRSDAGGNKTNRSVAEKSAPPSASGAEPAAPADGNRTASTAQGVEQIIQQDSSGATAGGTGEPARTFGTITFDANGNVVGGAPGDAVAAEPKNPVVAALPATDDPDELYRNSYQFILSGDYGTAEAGFRDHLARFPKDAKAADSHFWLGEALLGQQKSRDAA